MKGVEEGKLPVRYCPVSQVQRKFGLYVTGAGCELTRPGEPYPHEYHSSDYYFTWRNGRILPDWEYQLLYIQKGRGVVQFVRGRSIPVAEGSVIILHPGEWHRYRPDPETGWSEAYIGIGGRHLASIISDPFFPPPPIVMKTAPGGRFERELMALVGEIQACSAERPYTLALKAAALVASLCEERTESDRKSAHNVAIRRANLHIAHHLGEVVNFPALAKRLGMGYTLFRRLFREYNGMAPLEYQIALRIRRAAHLLESSDAPIAQIASETGFRTPAYFSRFFREQTGRSPQQHRIASGG